MSAAMYSCPGAAERAGSAPDPAEARAITTSTMARPVLRTNTELSQNRRPRLSSSCTGDPAVERDHRAREVRAGAGSEEDDDAGGVVRASDAAERHGLRDSLRGVLVLEEEGHHLA